MKVLKVLTLLFFTLISSILYSQNVDGAKGDSVVVSDVKPKVDIAHKDELSQSSSSVINTINMSESEIRRLNRKIRKDSIRATKKVWFSILGGPSYTPEASVGIAAAALISFKASKTDSLSQRSFFPFGVNFSINGTLVVGGSGSLFFNENKFRIYTNYAYRLEPANYYGKGMDAAESVVMSDSTTAFKKQNIQVYPRFMWEVAPKLYLGGLFDVSYTKSTNLAAAMAVDSYVNQFKLKYTNIGLGGVIQYDTRDDIATPHKGVFLSVMPKFYGRYLGGSYNYSILDLEYRQFQPLFARATLGWVARSVLSFGDVPFTELPTFGSPFDLRGFYVGQYRDRKMAYGIAEFRQMFGSQEDYDLGKFYAKMGYVAWVGTGSVANSVSELNRWKFNYGAGLRIQIQPGKNFRLDVGKGHGQKGVLVYFNMTEAF